MQVARFRVSPRGNVRVRALTQSEVDVMAMAAVGESNKAIAYALGLAPSTVAGKISEVMAKLGVRSRVELIRVSTHLLDGLTLGVTVSDSDGGRCAVGELPPLVPVPGVRLSPAERELLLLLGEGRSTAAMAAIRGTASKTVSNQLARLYRKFGVSSRCELVANLAWWGRQAQRSEQDR